MKYAEWDLWWKTLCLLFLMAKNDTKEEAFFDVWFSEVEDNNPKFRVES